MSSSSAAAVRSSSTLESLRELISAVTFRPKEHLPCPGVRSGLPTGALCEVSGAGKTEFVVKFLAEHPKMRVAWIEDQISIYPWAVSQRNAFLDRMLFIEAGNDSFWAVMQALRSQLFNTVIFSSTTTVRRGQAFYRSNLLESNPGWAWVRQQKSLRSLQLAAEKSRATMIFLTDEPGDAWPVSMQIQVHRDEIQVLRQR